MKTTKYVLALAIIFGLIGIVSPTHAQADTINTTPTSFGVGVGVPEANFQNNVSVATLNTPNASLSADLTSNTLTLGVKLTDTGHTSSGGAVLADGFTVLGGPAMVSFNITGKYIGVDVDSGLGFGVDTYADWARGGNNIQNFFFSSSTWPGSMTINMPISSADQGIIVRMQGDASGVATSLDPFIIDFLDPVTINFTPSPGGSVTLATGQVFTSAAPEPSSLLLLGTGLLGGIGVIRRKLIE